MKDFIKGIFQQVAEDLEFFPLGKESHLCNGVRSLSAFNPFTKNIADREELHVAPLTF